MREPDRIINNPIDGKTIFEWEHTRFGKTGVFVVAVPTPLDARVLEANKDSAISYFRYIILNPERFISDAEYKVT